jgi:Uma2 family endonuclease
MADFLRDPRSAEGPTPALAFSPDHARVAQNVAAVVDRSLASRRPCRAVRGGSVRLPPHAGGPTYAPDVLVTCEPADAHAAYVGAPWLVVEVDDPGFPRTALVPGYAAIPSVREIWVVSSHSRVVMVWHETGAGWRTTLPLIDDQTFPSHVLGLEVPLAELYASTDIRRSTEHSAKYPCA